MLHPLHIVMFVITGSSRFVARLATVQTLCSLAHQVHELHRLDRISFSHQVNLSTQFTSLYFVMMSCNTASDVSSASPAMYTTSHTSLLPYLTADTRLALTSGTELSPRQDHQPTRTCFRTDVTPHLISWRDSLMSRTSAIDGCHELCLLHLSDLNRVRHALIEFTAGQQILVPCDLTTCVRFTC